MTNQHPLTDDILISRFLEHARKFNSYTFDYTADGMRAAADWQLEQVLAHMAVKWLWLPGSQINELREAMRPGPT